METNGQEIPLRDNVCTIVGESPAFGPVAFASEFDDDARQPVDPGTVFRGRVDRLYAYWPYAGVAADETFDYVWYHNGEVFHGSTVAFGDEDGYAWQWIYNDDGAPLDSGLYQFYVTANGRTVIARQAIIGGDGVVTRSSPGAASRPAFGPLVFSTLFDSGSQMPINPDGQFEYGANALYGHWSYQDVRPGIPTATSGHTTGCSFREVWATSGRHPGRPGNGRFALIRLRWIPETTSCPLLWEVR